MDAYFPLKLTHILSSTLLFGTGLGTAFFAVTAHRSGQIATIAQTWRHVVWADNLFTWPAVLIQPLTGYFLMQRLGLNFEIHWIKLTLWLYILIGACWLPVLWLQARMRDLALQAWKNDQPLPAPYHRYFRIWFVLGWPAFISVLGVFALMVMKPSG